MKYNKPRKNWEKQFKDATNKGFKAEENDNDFDYPTTYWNYGIMAHEDPNRSISFAVHEIYYENDVPVSYTENAIPAHGDSIKEVIQDLQMMLNDIQNKPVLWAGEKFPQEYKSLSELIKKVKKNNIHKETNTEKTIGNEEW